MLSHHLAFPYKDGMHFVDTLRTPSKQDQFLKAIELVPQTFIYSNITWHDERHVTIEKIKFNSSMRNTLESPVLKADPGLEKRMKKLYKSLRAFNPTFDLTVTYEILPEGIAIDYMLNHIGLFGL